MSATYVYDRREQFMKPIVTVYDDEHIEPVIMAIYGCYPEFIYETKTRLHPYDRDPYSHKPTDPSKLHLKS